MKLDIRIEDEAWEKALPEVEAVCQRAADAAGARIDSPDLVDAEAALLLTNDGALHALNRQWRGKDKPTDILSFPSEDGDMPFLGDMAIAYGVASQDAESMGKTLSDHVSHLVVHGLLHLIGYDHETDDEAEEMEALERAILASLGLPDPYCLRDGAPDAP